MAWYTGIFSFFGKAMDNVNKRNELKNSEEMKERKLEQREQELKEEMADLIEEGDVEELRKKIS